MRSDIDRVFEINSKPMFQDLLLANSVHNHVTRWLKPDIDFYLIHGLYMVVVEHKVLEVVENG